MFFRTFPPGLKRSSDPPTTTMLAGFISFSFIMTYSKSPGNNFLINNNLITPGNPGL
jgi:hypothetical protein